MEYNDENKRNMEDLRNYIESKYGKSYMSAISKLNNLNQFDEKGILKPELALNLKEKEALLYYIPETSEFLDKIDFSMETFYKRYQKFLYDVIKTTIETGSTQEIPTDSKAVSWKIGVEFVDWKIKSKYGEDVYKKICEEVPYEKVPNNSGGFCRMFNRDFTNASRRLGYIIHTGVSASPLMDLDLFIKCLEKKGISSYIDFEANTFLYNAVPVKRKKLEDKS